MIPPLTPAKMTALQRAPLKFQPGRQPMPPDSRGWPAATAGYMRISTKNMQKSPGAACLVTARFLRPARQSSQHRPFGTITVSLASPYFAPMNWITIGIALSFAFLAVAVAVFAYMAFR